jgi:membrane protease YdiL (CAAX protease family)
MQMEAQSGVTGAGLELQPSRKVQFLELLVFLFLIVPSLGSSFLIAGDQSHLQFVAAALFSILNDLALVSLVAYFMWRNKEPPHRVGWTRGNVWREIGWGLLLFFPVSYGASLLEAFLHAFGFSAPSHLPSFLAATGIGNALLALVLVTVVAFVEETVFRGYLILRFKTVTRRTIAAILLSSAVFSLGHGYEGTAGVISIFWLGVLLALIYVWRKSLVAPVVIHFLTDFSSIVLTILLAPKP